jgi:hypothetical protein
VAIEYRGTVFTSKIVQRFGIGETDTEIEVIHSDRGQENIALSNAELLAVTETYTAAKNLRLYDGRLTLSNVKKQQDVDISAWAQTITHSIEQDFIDGVGPAFSFASDLKNSEAGYKFGEYQDPNNVLNKVGYFFNETYRFGIQVQWKDTNRWSAPFWVDDMRIDGSPTNVIGDRRSGASVDTNLQDANGRTKVYYVKFGTINLDKDKDGLFVGTKIRDLISGFRIVRSERIPEVLATGMFFAGVTAADGRSTPAPIVPFMGFTKPLNFPFGKSAQYVTGSVRQNIVTQYDNNGTFTTVTSVATTSDDSDYLFFYGPDLYFNNLNYAFASSDKIKVIAVVFRKVDSTSFASPMIYISVFFRRTRVITNNINMYRFAPVLFQGKFKLPFFSVSGNITC